MVAFICDWVYILRSPLIGQDAFICRVNEGLISNGVDIAISVGVLAKCERIIENLIFPHVEVQNYNQHNNSIVKPFSSDMNLPVFFLTEAR